MNQEPFTVGVDLESKSTANDLLDCIGAFVLFVDRLRVDGLKANGENDQCTTLIANLVDLFRDADEHGEELSLLGAFAPDILYKRICELQSFDGWTRAYAAKVPQLLFDQLRVRGISSFYILDNSIQEDRFEALVNIFSDVGYSVISPNLDGASEAEVLDQVESLQILRKHILYVERDTSVNYLDAVRGIQKRPWYTVAFRNQAPTLNSVTILQLAGGQTRTAADPHEPPCGDPNEPAR